jgi:hypothetical protein
MKLTLEQIEAVVAWMEEWEMLAGTEVPKAFREDFSDKAIPDNGLFDNKTERCLYHGVTSSELDSFFKSLKGVDKVGNDGFSFNFKGKECVGLLSRFHALLVLTIRPMMSNDDIGAGCGNSIKMDFTADAESQIWQPTPRLRWQTSKTEYENIYNKKRILQQLFIDGKGNEEWRNVEVVD